MEILLLLQGLIRPVLQLASARLLTILDCGHVENLEILVGNEMDVKCMHCKLAINGFSTRLKAHILVAPDLSYLRIGTGYGRSSRDPYICRHAPVLLRSRLPGSEVPKSWADKPTGSDFFLAASFTVSDAKCIPTLS